MNLKQTASHFTDLRTVAACVIASVAAIGTSAIWASDVKRNADKVPTLEQLAQEQSEANKLVQQQLEQQQKLLDLLIRERLTGPTPTPAD